MTCSVSDCEREAVARGMCWGHYKRTQRGRPSSAPLRPRGNPWNRVFEAGLALAGAEEDEDFARLRERLRGAIRNFARTHAPVVRRK